MDLTAQVQIGPMLPKALPEGRILASIEGQVRRAFRCDRAEDRRVPHRDDVLDAGIVGDDAFQPGELLARDLGDDTPLWPGAFLEHIQRREQRVLVNEPEGGAPHAKRTVQRHSKILLELAAEGVGEFGLLLGPGGSADLVVAHRRVERQPVVLHPPGPGAVVDLRKLLDGVLVRPVAHDQIAQNQDKLGVLSLDRFEDIVQRVLPAGLRIGEIRVHKVGNAHEPPGPHRRDAAFRDLHPCGPEDTVEDQPAERLHGPVLVEMPARETETATTIGPGVRPGKDLVLRISRRQLARQDRDHVGIVVSQANVEVPLVLRDVPAAASRDRMAVRDRRHFHNVDRVLRDAHLVRAAHPVEEIRHRPFGRIDGIVQKSDSLALPGKLPHLFDPAGDRKRVMLASIGEEHHSVHVVQDRGILRPAVVIDVDLRRLDVRRLLQALFDELRILVPIVATLAVAGLAGQECDLLRLCPRRRRQTRRPGRAAAEQLPHRGPEGLHIMSQRRMEHPALAILQDEGHRVIPAVNFRFRSRQHMDRGRPGQARIQFVDRLKRLESLSNRMIRIHDPDLEGPVRIVTSQLRVVDLADELLELGPALERAAGKVDGDESAAFAREVHEVLPGLVSRIGGLPVHEVQHGHIVARQLLGRQELRRLDHIDLQPSVLSQFRRQNRRRLLPFVPRVVDPRDDHHLACFGFSRLETCAQTEHRHNGTQPRRPRATTAFHVIPLDEWRARHTLQYSSSYDTGRLPEQTRERKCFLGTRVQRHGFVQFQRFGGRLIPQVRLEFDRPGGYYSAR